MDQTHGTKCMRTDESRNVAIPGTVERQCRATANKCTHEKRNSRYPKKQPRQHTHRTSVSVRSRLLGKVLATSLGRMTCLYIIIIMKVSSLRFTQCVYEVSNHPRESKNNRVSSIAVVGSIDPSACKHGRTDIRRHRRHTFRCIQSARHP